MNNTFVRKEINGKKFNILALPDTNLFKFEMVNMYGANIERVIEKRESKNVYGIAHFIEHLGFRAPRDYTTSELLKNLKTKGTHNASTNHDRINYWFKTTMDKSSLAINLVCNYALNNLTNISQEEFDIEKKVVYNEAKRYLDDDQTMFYFNTEPTILVNNPQDNILGIPEVIDTFKLVDVIYIKKLMMNCGETIFNITYDPTVSGIDTILADVTKELATFDTDDEYLYPQIVSDYVNMLKVPEVGDYTVENGSDQAMTSLIFDVVTNTRTAAIASAYLLSFAETSLNTIIREDNGLTYGVRLGVSRIAYHDMIKFSCDVTRGDEETLMKLFHDSVNTSVDSFDEENYKVLMDAINLKQTMLYLDRQQYDSLHWKAINQPGQVNTVSELLETNISDAFTELDNLYGSFEDIKTYLLRFQQMMNDGSYIKVVN